MAIKVGINGFGRIGRNLFRAAMGDKDIDIVAVNDITDPKTLAHLLKYDSVLGNLKADVTCGTKTALKSMAKTIKVFKERDPAKIDWPVAGMSMWLSNPPDCSRMPKMRRNICAGPSRRSLSRRRRKARTSRSASASTTRATTQPNTT